MTHPLKKISVVELQNALAETLKNLTGVDCEVNVKDIDFQEMDNFSLKENALASIQIKFDLDYSDGKQPF